MWRIVFSLQLLSFILTPVAARAWSDNPTTPEGWAWAQIGLGKVADFNARCGATLDPQRPDGWDDPCRQISPAFLVDVLTIPKWKEGVPLHGVRLHGAHIVGSIDLRNADISPEVWVDKSVITGDIVLSDAHLKKLLSLDGSVVGGQLLMTRVNADSTVTLSEGAWFHGDVDMNEITIRGSLFMRDHGRFDGNVILIGANIGGNIEMDSVSISKELIANRLEVGGSVDLDENAFFGGEVILPVARIAGILDLTSASASSIDLTDLSSGTGGELRLAGMKWRCRQIAEKKETNAPPEIVPVNAVKKWPLGDNVAKRTNDCGDKFELLPRLILRNAHIETIEDDTESWPPLIDLEGLRYSRLGDAPFVASADRNMRTREEWFDWLSRDRTFSEQPYYQLAAVLAAAGQRDASESILFAGRERERNLTWSSTNKELWRWLRHDFSSWVWLSILSGIAGYGIGIYTFRVLWWVATLTIVGAVVLRFSPYARERSVPWRFGASLHRLLPVIQLNKEFQDFFDNIAEPGKPLKFHPWQMAFFSGFALAGWVLGFFLLAALGGLIQK